MIEWTQPQSWCDLGCGSGTFKIALAQSLASASTIQAVDLDHEALEVIPGRIAELQFVKCWGSSEL